MKKNILILLILGFSLFNSIAQEEEKLTKKDLKETVKSVLDSVTKAQDTLLQNQETQIRNNTVENFKKLLSELKGKTNISPETISSLEEKTDQLDNTSNDINKTIEEIASKINELIKLNEKEFIGTFNLVNKGKNIPIYKNEEVKDSVNIAKINIEIKDGVIYDIIATPDTSNANSNEFFYNKSTTSIFSFNKKGTTLRLYSNLNKSGSEKYLELIDLVSFIHENGKKYVIESAHVNLSSPDKESFKISIDNNLKSIIDFRIYSDFLGLINEASNGIVSFEGSSTFFLNPYSIGYFNYIFKKLKTKVRYSRFDNDDREVSSSLNDNLDLIQKSFFNFGGELDLYEIRFGKKFPYKLITKAKGSLDITEVSEEISEDASFTTSTLSLGLGAEIQIERYHNFGLHTSFYFNRYQNNNILEDGVLNFDTFTINSEVYFYTPGSKNDAIFIRAQYEQGRRDLPSSSNFFTVQFGYKAELNFKQKD